MKKFLALTLTAILLLTSCLSATAFADGDVEILEEVVETPVKEEPEATEEKIEETPVEEVPVEEAPVEEAPVEEQPTEVENELEEIAQQPMMLLAASPEAGQSVDVTPSTSKPSKSAAIEIGETLTINVTNDSDRSGYTFTAVSSKPGIASVANGSVEIASKATGSVTVTGKANGTATITISNGTSSYSRIATVTVTVGTGEEEKPKADATVDVEPNADNPDIKEAQIAVGKTLEIKVENAGSSTYEFTVTSPNAAVASVYEETISIAKGETASFYVTGKTEGYVEIAIKNKNQYGDQYARKATVKLTVGDGEQPQGDTKKFEYASSVEKGKEYLLVSGGYALTNAGSAKVSATAVEVKSNTITIDASDAMIWTAGESSSFTGQGTVTFQNGSNYFARTGGSSNTAGTETSVSAKSVWTYDGSDLCHKNSDKTLTFYATYSNGFTVNVQNAGSAELKLYALVEEDEPELKDLTVEPKTLNLTVGGETGKITVTGVTATFTSNDTTKATVGTDGTVTAVAEGETTITVSAPGYNDATVAVTVAKAVEPPVEGDSVVYELANAFEIGKTYLIVTVNDGNGKALANNSNTFDTVDVTVANQKITLSKDDAAKLAKAEWEAKETTTGSGLIGLYNGSNVLKVNAAQSTPTIKTSDSSYNAGGFGYTQSQHVSYPYGSPAKDYYIGSGTGTFVASNTETSLGKVYIFARSNTEAGESDDDDPTGTGLYVAFTSDVHNQSGDASSTRLNNWINTVTKDKINNKFDNFGFCGDMGPASGSSSSFWTNAQKVMDVVKNNTNVKNNGFYVCGNHEYNPGNYSHGTNSTTQAYSDAGTAYKGSGYILYSLGARQFNEIYSENDINALKTFLDNNADYTGPIFILAHFPLHCYNGYTSGEDSNVHSGRAATGTADLIEVLNNAVTKNGQNIFFLWGHNHSGSNDHYDAVYTDKINNTAIKFTYAAAGCMSDSEYGASANVKGKGLVAHITSDNVTLTYYNAKGGVVGTPTTIKLNKNGGTGEDEPTVKVSTDKLTIEEGKTGTFTITVTGGTAMVTSGNMSVATVKQDGNTVTVTAVAEGKTDITVSVGDVTKKVAVEVTKKPGEEPGTPSDDPVNTLTPGKYLIYSNGKVLVNNNGKTEAKTVDAIDDKLQITSDMVWTVEAANSSLSSYGGYTISNNGLYITRDSAGGTDNSVAAKLEGGSANQYKAWNFANNFLNQNGGNSGSYPYYGDNSAYYFYYSNTNSVFATYPSETGNSDHHVYLYKVDEDTPIVQPTVEVSTDKLSIEEGKTDTFTVTTTGGTATVKSGDEKVATVKQEGDTVTVTAVGEGKTDITVSVGDVEKKVAVEVTEATGGDEPTEEKTHYSVTKDGAYASIKLDDGCVGIANPVLYVVWSYTLADGSNFSYTRTFTADNTDPDLANYNFRIGNPKAPAGATLDSMLFVVCDDLDLELADVATANAKGYGFKVITEGL